mmetsp:Transcript_28987/g.55539  ORF Transcript_28987/g.55539 Transcript_28987/m.55539 type:complete len:200 (-) Transcript_28987:2060-2659(-)
MCETTTQGCSSCRKLSAHIDEGKGHELIAITMIELVLELHPMETKGMEEGTQRFHSHQHAERGHGPHKEAHRHHHWIAVADAHHEDAFPEDVRELRVREAQCPQPQVRSRVGHRPQHKLNRVNDLMHQHVRELKLRLRAVVDVVILPQSVVTGNQFLLVLLLEEKGLGEQHPWHANKHHQKQEELQAALTRKHEVLGAS